MVITHDDELMDWANNIPDDCEFDFLDDPVSADYLGSSLSIDEIENYLLNDDSVFSQQEDNPKYFESEEFFSGVLPDSPLLGLDQSPEIGGEEEENEEKENEDSSHKKIDLPTDEKNCANVIVESEDHVDKKLKRQMRNRDSAVRSRERKKLYVKDLESKSRYYEAECKRLGALLHCCLSENHTLKLSLHKAFDSSNKQESAVLLLESLLMGSLLGFLGIIMYLVILHHQALQNQSRKELFESTRKTRKEEFHRVPMMLGKQYKASRSRMRLTSSSFLQVSYIIFSSSHTFITS